MPLSPDPIPNYSAFTLKQVLTKHSLIKLAQEYITLHDTQFENKELLHEALTRCKNCDHVVPKTMLCLYCGSPILYKHPKEEK